MEGIPMFGEHKTTIVAELIEKRFKVSDGERSIRVVLDKQGTLTVTNHRGDRDFVFQNSKPDMIKRIALLLKTAAEDIRWND